MAHLGLEGVTRITYIIDRPLMLNFCIAKTKGRSRKSQWYQSAGGSFDVPEGRSIVAGRLMGRDLLRKIAARPLKGLHRLQRKAG